MKICSKCKVAVVNGVCPLCERTKFITEAKEDDLVIVKETDYVSSFLIEDILNEAGIRFMKKGSLGRAVTLYVGEMSESFIFYVMAKDYDKALELIPDFELNEEDFDEN